MMDARYPYVLAYVNIESWVDSARILIKNTEIGARAEEEESKKNENFVGMLWKQDNLYSPFD